MQALFVAGHRSREVWSELVRLPISGEQAEERKFTWEVLVTIKALDAPEEKGREVVTKLTEAGESMEQPLTPEAMREWWENLMAECDFQVNFVAAQIEAGGRVIILTNGETRALAVRENQGGYLFEPDKPDWQLLEGEYAAGDKWFWGTEAWFEKMPANEILEDLKKNEIEEIQAGLMTKLQGREAKGIAGVIIGFDTTSLEKTETEAIQPEVFLKNKSFKRRRFIFWGILILGLLFLGGFLGGKRRVQVSETKKYEAMEMQVNQSINQAKLWADEQQTASAAALLKTTGEMIKRTQADLKENQKLVDALELKLKEVETTYTAVSGEEQVKVDQAWYDLDIVKEGLYGTRMDQTGERMEIIDGTAGMVISLGFDKKQASLTGNGQLMVGSTLIAASGKRTAVYNPGKGIYEVNTDKKTVGELLGADPTWQRITGMALFAGNVYLIDAGLSQIYVYPGVEAGVGEKRSWLKPEQSPDLSQVIDVAVDGDLWTLDTTGKVRRFRQGEQIDYLVKGLEVPVAKAAAIVIPEDSETIYILDQGNKRVVLLDKKGNYQKQYGWEGLAAATDLAVDEKGGAILVLLGSEIYQIPLVTGQN